jgi:hypothetical protein
MTALPAAGAPRPASPSRPTGAAPRAAADAPVACFAVHAVAGPGVLPRVVEQFAKRGWTPSSLEARVAGAEIAIDLQMPGLGRDDAALVAAALRGIVGVQAVLTAERLATRD